MRSLNDLAVTLRQHGDRSVSELADVLGKAWAKKERKSAAKATAPSSVPSVDEFVTFLHEQRDDAVAFEAVLKQLAARSIKPVEVASVANLYRGTKSSFKSKAVAIEAIRKAWKEKQRDVAKAKLIGEIF